MGAANTGESGSFVSPWDVEFKPNPFIFSHLRGSLRDADPITPVSAISANSPTNCFPVHEQGPFEMDAVESEFNPWCHPPRTMINGVPHRWEQTLGSDRRMFEAEHGLLTSRRKRARPEQLTPPESPQRKRKGKQFETEDSSPLQLESKIDRIENLTLCSPATSISNSAPGVPSYTQALKGKCRGRRFESEASTSKHPAESIQSYASTSSRSPTSNMVSMKLSQAQEINPQWYVGQSDDDRLLTQLTRQASPDTSSETGPMSWNGVDISFATQLAALHLQQVKFFEKFHGMPVTPVSPATDRGSFNFSACSSCTSSPTRSSMLSFGSSIMPARSNSSAASSISMANASANQSTTNVTIEPPAKETKNVELKYPCPDCDDKFRTPGLRTNHYNRKHNLRYKCVVCSAAFGLRKDLERHKSTVHKESFSTEVSLFCTNPGCATPMKEFNRKDNFKRHVERCREAIETRGTAR